MCVCVCVCVCLFVHVRAYVCVCGWVLVFLCVCVWCVRMCRRVLCIALSLSVQPRSSPSFHVYWTHLLTMASRPTDPYAGEHCKKIDLTIEQFYRATTSPSTVKIVNIKNGLIYELSQVRKCRHTPWIAFYDAVKAICDSSFTTPFTSFKVMVGRLESRRSLLIRNKKKR